MPLTPEQARGLVFESEAALALGLTQTAGSGNQSRDRSDARGHLRLSCKASSDRVTFTELKRHLAEAVDLAYGTDETPALALEDHDGDQILVMRLQDAAQWLTAHAGAVERKPSRAERVRGNAQIPIALRDES